VRRQPTARVRSCCCCCLRIAPGDLDQQGRRQACRSKRAHRTDGPDEEARPPTTRW